MVGQDGRAHERLRAGEEEYEEAAEILSSAMPSIGSSAYDTEQERARTAAYEGGEGDDDEQAEPTVQAVEVGDVVFVVEAEDGHEAHNRAHETHAVQRSVNALQRPIARSAARCDAVNDFHWSTERASAPCSCRGRTAARGRRAQPASSRRAAQAS
jgi:hypothetical protein